MSANDIKAKADDLSNVDLPLAEKVDLPIRLSYDRTALAVDEYQPRKPPPRTAEVHHEAYGSEKGHDAGEQGL